MRLLPCLLLTLLTACTFVQDRYPTLPPGPYRAVLELEYNPIVPNPKGAPIEEKTDLAFDEVTEGILPFNFEVIYETDTTFRMEIHNGEEVITVPAKNIRTGRDQTIGRDTLYIDFPVYGTHIEAYHEENVIEGVWVVPHRDNYRIPFKAYFGQGHRFTTLRKEPVMDVSGTWAVNFGTEDEGFYPGIAEFQQNGNALTGTFRTETGDYRFLEGTVQANKLYLSVFDGSHAFLFEALIKDDNTLSGSFRSGRHYITNWTAERNPDFRLASPDSLTTALSDEPLDFTFATVNGDSVSLTDDRFAGKPKIIKIMGTWCPNCRDEADFLKQYLEENDVRDLQIIALAYERYGADDDRSRAAIRRYVENMNTPWPILLAGPTSKAEASKTLPQLNRIISYPTMIFLDRENRIQRIHTGFNGPATSEYAAFTRSFDASVRALLAESSR